MAGTNGGPPRLNKDAICLTDRGNRGLGAITCPRAKRDRGVAGADLLEAEQLFRDNARLSIHASTAKH